MSMSLELQKLQDELLALKAKYPDILRLRKEKPLKASPIPPSPPPPLTVVVTISIDAPSSAFHIDIDILTIQTTITQTTPADDQAATENDAPSPSPPFSISIEILGAELPNRLKHAIASELESVRIQHNNSVFEGISAVIDVATKDFVRLLCLVPELLERYEGVDSEGRTVRRITVVNEEEPPIWGVVAPCVGGDETAPRPSPARGSDTKTIPGSTNSVLESEVEALKKRYQVTFITNEEEDEEREREEGLVPTMSSLRIGAPPQHTTLMISITPTDPLWPSPKGPSPLTLLCSITDAHRYPAPNSFSMTLSKHATTAHLVPMSDQECAVFNKLLEMHVADAEGRPNAMHDVLRYCENRAGEMVNQAVDMALEIERRRKGRGEEGGGVMSSSATKTGSSLYSFDDDDDEEGDEEYHVNPTKETKETPILVHNAVRLLLQGLALSDVDTLDIIKITLQVQCIRCKAIGDVHVSEEEADDGNQGQSRRRRHFSHHSSCPTCHLEWDLTMLPSIVHESNNSLATLRAEGCTPVDMLPSMVEGQCSQCYHVGAFRSVQVGRWSERNCSHCHRRIAFLIDGVAFEPIVSSSAASRGETKTQRQQGQQEQQGSSTAGNQYTLVPGEPLPNNGACRHYRHSYRWLRFPCCGRRFACDLCHEEQTDGHEMAWANRMVCGYCSTEQPVSSTCCSSSCGKKVATSASRPSGRNTAFWEGGEGQRDKHRLSKRDPHKYRNSKAKTHSRKNRRVGAKASATTKVG